MGLASPWVGGIKGRVGVASTGAVRLKRIVIPANGFLPTTRVSAARDRHPDLSWPDAGLGSLRCRAHGKEVEARINYAASEWWCFSQR